jgi:hypothetical protein
VARSEERCQEPIAWRGAGPSRVVRDSAGASARQFMTERITRAEIERARAMLDGTYEPPPPREVDLEQVALFGGLAGVNIEPANFSLAKGLTIRSTFAHVMAPYMLAFAPPPRPGAPHPAPWRAARGGLGFDVLVEIAVAADERPTSFDRLHTLWWTLALIRLRTGAPARMPVISDRSYAEIAHSDKEPVLWTIEMAPAQLRLCPDPPRVVSEAGLSWVRDHLVSGADLMRDEAFGRGMQTLDSIVWAHSIGAAVVMAWAAVETLFRPGRQNISKTLAAAIAAYLEPPSPARERLFQLVRSLYEARGGTAHAARQPEPDALFASLAVARAVFCTAIERCEPPDVTALIGAWSERRPFDDIVPVSRYPD